MCDTPSHEPAVPPDGGLVRVRLDLGYDGTAFSGWARQPARRTVQSEIEGALRTVLRLTETPETTVAGRTDAGVHARGQVAHVDLPSRAWHAVPGRSDAGPGVALVRRLAGVLPPDVRVRSAQEAAPGFDARFSALSRRYAYRLNDDPGGVDPLRRHDTVWHPRLLHVDAAHDAAQRLLGEHDFAAFCRRRLGASTVRRLLRVRWSRAADGLTVVDVEADAFCHSMVRALVGALLAVADGRRPVDWPAAVLAAGVRDPAVMVAPARGLTLEQVSYPAPAGLAARAAVTRATRGPVATG